MHLPALIAAAEIDAVVLDSGSPRHPAFDLPVRAACGRRSRRWSRCRPRACRTEWVLLTSGTTGVPKMVVHDLAALTAAIAATSPADGADGLGHVLRHPPLRRAADFPARGARRRLAGAFERRRTGRAIIWRGLRAHGVDPYFRHAVALAARADESRRPQRSRRAMCACRARSPTRRSSTTCARRFRDATIGHAYASTEAGVGFDVNDGLRRLSGELSSAPRATASR